MCYLEDLEEITAKKLFVWYQNIVEKADVKILFCGEMSERGKILSLRQDFPGKVPFLKKEEPDQPKNGPRFLQEKEKMEQTRLCLGFSADVGNGCRQAALMLLNYLLGGSPDSLLFQKIREEAGLCYDVRSYLEPMSPFLFVQAGIRPEDVKETGKKVLQCIEHLKKEGISQEKLGQAKENILRQYDSMADSPWAMVDFMAEQVLQGRELTTEKIQRQLERTDAEDILHAANHLEFKVVYLLGGKEETRDAE